MNCNHKVRRGTSFIERSSLKYGRLLTRQVRVVLAIITVALPLPFYTMIYEQHSSTLIVQAAKMDGSLTETFYIWPTNVKIVGSILGIILIPLFYYVLNPLSIKYKILHTPLQRLGAGFVFTLISFICFTVLNALIDTMSVELPSKGFTKWNIYNNFDTDLDILKYDLFHQRFLIERMSVYQHPNIRLRSNSISAQLKMKIDRQTYEYTVKLYNEKITGCYFSEPYKLTQFRDDNNKDIQRGFAKIRMLLNSKNKNYNYELKNTYYSELSISGELADDDVKFVAQGDYQFIVDGVEKAKYFFKTGGVYALLIYVKDNSTFVSS